jgi:hypothetical protein
MVEVAKTLPRVTEEQKRLVALSGNEAQAEAMRQINPDVVAAYPITPQTEIVMQFAQFVADGKVETEYILVESEHSAMSACIGAAAGREGYDRNFVARSGFDVGVALHRFWVEVAYSHGCCRSFPFRQPEHPL